MIEQEIAQIIIDHAYAFRDGKQPNSLDAAEKILDLFKPETVIVNEMHFVDGKMDINVQHPLFIGICSEIVKTFDDAKGINYVEFTMEHKTRGEFSVLIQRHDGMTPAEKNIILTAENARMKELIG